jgi:DNA-binding CsgD family transcriptional regulator
VASASGVRELTELTGTSELSDASDLADQLDLVVLDVRLSRRAGGLSPKEQEVLAQYASGNKWIAVAHRVGLSSSTVAEYVRRIRYKYATDTRWWAGLHTPKSTSISAPLKTASFPTLIMGDPATLVTDRQKYSGVEVGAELPH